MEVDKTIVAQKVTVASGDGAYFLAGLTGPLTGRRIELPPNGAILGRAVDAAIQVKDPAVSSRHCRIAIIMGQVIVQDLGSSNGTFIDEGLVSDPQTFPIGSVLQIGNSLFKLEFRSRQEVLEEERQGRELEKAAGYVRALLPPPLTVPPVITEWRFIPSDQLGGDAFGYHFLDDGRFALYLVDVCGHGAAPALHSVAVINNLRKQSVPHVDFTRPEQVLRALNDAYQMEEHANMYFTLWYGVLDVASRKLVYASGGHPPALLIDANGTASRLRTPNLAIGMLRGVNYQAAEVEIPAGSRLYLYSDGAYEVVTKAGEEWRVEEFLEVLQREPQTGLAETARVEREVRAVMQGSVFDDDFSLMVFRFP
jgi:sigma-B regulation protein RsbU (phosphoserine phosphatase)